MPINKIIQNRNRYYVTYNVQSQILTTIPGQLDPISPTIDNDLYLLLNGENGTGNATVSGTPSNQVPYPGFSGARIIYSNLDRSLYNHQMVTIFRGGFHPGSSFKNIFSTANARYGSRYWFAPGFPSNPNVTYFPKFKVTLDNFVAGCSIKISKPPANRVASPPFSISLLGTSWEPSNTGWYTYLTVEPQIDPTPAYLATSTSGQTIDKKVAGKLNLVLYFIYNNSIITQHTLQNFTYNSWVDLAWSYNNNTILLSLNNDTRAYYSMPKLNAPIAGSFDVVLGPTIPNCYRFMGSLDNLYIKKYTA